MKFLVFISDFIIPLMIFYIVGHGILMKKNVYDDFVKGAKDGFKTVIRIMPTLIGLMVAVGILRASGFLDMIADVLGRFTNVIHLPSQLVPLIIVRMFSSSAATSLVLDIFKQYGPDSVLGTITSIMMSCTETIFYTMSVYFMTAKVTKTRYTLAGALVATFAGVAASLILAGML
ncbi:MULTISPECIES: nucleoside recognition domain-containing protein [Diplocloster]|uniref:Spore maturation protein n=1 Tax=Diplocloster modestus TaxID=2850322 RepID=A0ABS6KCV5_9FIRM|nr:nucleoside recognition domain-containing protein [Diplocloster modestus]MBU9728323.1 spore maturation protein [Diplocloster modestus]